MPELGTYGSVRGVSGNGHSYRDTVRRGFFPVQASEEFHIYRHPMESKSGVRRETGKE